MADEKQKPPVADPRDMAAKRQLHERADELNVIEQRNGRAMLCCGARKKKGKTGHCKSIAGMGTDHPGVGRCKHCGGASTGPTTAAGKAVVALNPRKHGFYSEALNERERAAYEEQMADASIGLQHEIYALKAKILVYLAGWKEKWEAYYKRKAAEKLVRYVCSVPECKAFTVRGDLEEVPGYCIRCGDRKMIIDESWAANRSHEDAEAYADHKSKVYYSEGDGPRSYYHAGTIEDRALDRALNTLSRLVEKHARLTNDDGEDFLGKINKELQAASQGRVTVSWGGKPQTRKAAADE